MRTLIVLAIAAVGCDDTIHLSVAFGTAATPVQVDTRCDNGGCQDPDQLEVQVSIEEDDRPAAEVEVRQYKVVYDLADVDGQPPYFAEETVLIVQAKKPATLIVRPAGELQREWVLSRAGYTRVDGTAALMLAGYDQDDRVVTAEGQFAIAFGDFVTGGDEGEPTDGGTP